MQDHVLCSGRPPRSSAAVTFPELEEEGPEVGETRCDFLLGLGGVKGSFKDTFLHLLCLCAALRDPCRADGAVKIQADPKSRQIRRLERKQHVLEVSAHVCRSPRLNALVKGIAALDRSSWV